ncbi:SDR family NAD(P)-dependent oxidoreductase [Clostridium luticellarii]|uniref:2-dehydro-3-deoxy-D-gluconate 5-dehydrogenase n=1 Tax=Clostridium luticellarii TaxID=1691940 RepID=A0A2T0BPL6_9CLOT|nr:SDR family NAD(P)-dependent oxidoreductase [Clostridium luticellarii]PRR85828.1 2-dehydro-3-deoxy-D-gluconate 5-dehydrogenase [Clostridium luticellarii]
MKNLFDVNGKKAIVTGGTRGLGYGMAEGLMENGCEVVIFGSNEKVHNVAKGFCDRGFKCHGIQVNLSKQDERVEAFKKAVELMSGLDILVNSAGVQSRHKSEEFPLEDYQYVLNVNLTTTFVLCQLAAREFLKNRGGKIINIASMLSFFGGYTVPAYAASKGGVAQLTKAFANEWAEHNINVNALAPGYMATEMNTALLDKNNPRYLEITNRIPAKRWGTGDDMKGAAIFLASEASDYLNGAIIPVDGGYLVK